MSALAKPQRRLLVALAEGKRLKAVALLFGEGTSAAAMRIKRLRDMAGVATTPALVSWAVAYRHIEPRIREGRLEVIDPHETPR